jgi:hypothetical protein
MIAAARLIADPSLACSRPWEPQRTRPPGGRVDDLDRQLRYGEQTMRFSSFRCAIAATATATLIFAAPAPAANSWATASGVRAQTTRFLNDELNDNGSDACAVLNSPQAGVPAHETCAQKWDAALRRLTASQRRALHADKRAVPTAQVTFSGSDLYATIALPTPLLGNSDRYYWTNNCWMLMRH